MKNIAIVNLLDYTSYFYEKVNGESQLDRVIKYANSLPDVSEVIFLLNKDIKEIDSKVVMDSWNEEKLISNLLTCSEKFDHLFYFYGDCPLLDTELSREMFIDHINYYAEYTFADGYPYGLAPEILDTEILSPLLVLAKGSSEEVKRDSIFNVVKKDINSFELETKISENDLRLLRVSLTSDSRRNFNLLSRIVDNGGIDSKSIMNVLVNKPELLITEPSFINLDITRKKVQDTPYLPERSGDKDFMCIKDVDTILDKVKKYSDDATFAFVTEYEPVTHPDFLEIIQKITAIDGFKLFIETSGIGWTQAFKDEVVSNSKINLIITLDALNKEVYSKIRGIGHDEAVAFAKEMISLVKDRAYIQATRMKSNEMDMEPFYRFWQELTDKIVIQKYSDYNKRLPDLKVADLSPLKRFPCWHIKRDLFVDITGNVRLCYNDTEGDYILGSLIHNDIEEIIAKRDEYYTDHINCNYSDFCRKCDEYYTFNF